MLVTGATGLVGSWLVKELLGRRRRRRRLVRDRDPQSRARPQRRHRARARSSTARSRTSRRSSAPSTSTRSTPSSTSAPRRSSASRTATRSRPSRRTSAAPTTCSRPAGATPTRAARSSSPRATRPTAKPTTLPYTEDIAARGTPSLRRHEGVRRPARAVLRPHLRRCRSAIARCGNIYGGGDLNWSRIVPGTIRSLLRGERPVIRSDGTLRPRLHLRRGRRRRPTSRSPRRVGTPGAARARRSTSATRSPLTVLELVRRDPPADGRRTSSRSCATRPSARSATRCSLRREGARASSAGRRGSTSTTGSTETIAWYRGVPRLTCAEPWRRRARLRRAARADPRARRTSTTTSAFAPRPFVPGETPVPVSGRVFDADELAPPRRRVARLLADHRPLRRRSSSASSPRASASGTRCSCNSGSSANLLARLGADVAEARRAPAAAGRRGDHRRRRLPDHGQPDRPEPARAGVRRRRARHLQRRRRRSSRPRVGAADAGDHARPHARQPVRPRRRDARSRRSTTCGCRGQLRRARLDATTGKHDRHVRRLGDASASTRPTTSRWARAARVLTEPAAAEAARRVVPRLGPRLLVRARARTTPAASASTGSSATCRTATTTSTSTRTSATT